MKTKLLLFATALLLAWLPAGTAKAGWMEDWYRWTGYGIGAGYHAPKSAPCNGPCGNAGAAPGAGVGDSLDMLRSSSPWSTRYRPAYQQMGYPGYPLR